MPDDVASNIWTENPRLIARSCKLMKPAVNAAMPKVRTEVAAFALLFDPATSATTVITVTASIASTATVVAEVFTPYR